MIKYQVMKSLSKKEKDIAYVAVDLFNKGTPEWRIAKYCKNSKMNRKQLNQFLYKLCIAPHVSQEIYQSFIDIESDKIGSGQAKGAQLKNWLNVAEKERLI